MEYIIAASIVVLWTGFGLFLFVTALDEDTLINPWSAAFLVWLVLIIAFVFRAASQEEQKGPCLRYETSMYWNSGAKTMMPARTCVERAEWVKP